jgi:DsbC/DsbD-like thiol-disulfide interchange protein
MNAGWLRRGAALTLLALGLAPPAALAVKQPLRVWEEVYVRVRAGATVQALFHVSVDAGYLVVARAVADAALRPLTLRLKPAAGVQVGDPAYPAPTATASVDGLPEFRAYEGVVGIRVPVTVPKDAKWTRQRLEGVLEYQACTADACTRPATLPVAVEIELRAD